MVLVIIIHSSTACLTYMSRPYCTDVSNFGSHLNGTGIAKCYYYVSVDAYSLLVVHWLFFLPNLFTFASFCCLICHSFADTNECCGCFSEVVTELICGKR